jgi:hypothetical protein
MAEKKKVLIALHHLGPRVVPVVRQLEAKGFEVLHNSLDCAHTEAELIATLPGVFATVAGVEPSCRPQKLRPLFIPC